MLKAVNLFCGVGRISPVKRWLYHITNAALNNLQPSYQTQFVKKIMMDHYM